MLRRTIPRPFRCEYSPYLTKICITHILGNMNYANTYLPFEMIFLNRAFISAQVCWLFFFFLVGNKRFIEIGNLEAKSFFE